MGNIGTFLRLVLLVSSIWSLAFAESSPEVPAILRDVSLVSGAQRVRPGVVSSGHFTRPAIPPVRTSNDGRIAINVKKREGNKVGFYLMAPEKLSAPFSNSSPGIQILSSTAAFQDGISVDHFIRPVNPRAVPGVSHFTLCDGTSQFPESGARNNPYACGDGGNSDCYDLTVVAGFGHQPVQLWGTPVTIRVSNPKTSNAAIVAVNLGAPVAGPSLPVSSFFEPMVTADGRLIVARFGPSPFTWTNPNTGRSTRARYDIVYSVNRSPSASACDVRQWSAFFPVSHAPYDTYMKANYGLAQYPYRDTEGNLIPDGLDLPATYPWVDKEGRNLFFTTLGSTLFNSSDGSTSTRYPVSCLPGVTCEDTSALRPRAIEEAGNTRGESVMGLWTHGKMVLLDNIINNTDYGLHMADSQQRMVQLYQASNGSAVSVSVGTGRENITAGGPAGYALNSTIIDSTENLFNYNTNLLPFSVRDVAWILNAGKVSAEVEFDDYLNPNGFIVSEMSGSLSLQAGSRLLNYHDGFNEGQDIHLQNAATAVSANWAIPSFGLGLGNTRIEPVALGGIQGKGVWLDGQSGIQYSIPPQPQDVNRTPWFFTLFLDSRFNDGQSAHRLLTFPDQSALVLVGTHSLRYQSPSGELAVQHEIVLPSSLRTGEWNQIALLVDNRSAGTTVSLFVDGFQSDVWTSLGSKLFQLVPGDLILGMGSEEDDEGNGFRGWIDDFKVFAESPDLETICNHARGSLVQLGSLAPADWKSRAASYPLAAHSQISEILPINAPPSTQFACYHDYGTNGPARDNVGISVRQLPLGMTSVRAAVHFPEGPLVYNRPRPDSSRNGFCLSCHAAGQPEVLSPNALSYNSGVLMQDDPRRQPLQPFRLLFGKMPANFMPGISSPSLPANSKGIGLDQFVFPH